MRAGERVEALAPLVAPAVATCVHVSLVAGKQALLPFLLGEVLEQTVSETTTQALEERELKPAMQPRIEVTQFEEGKALEYTIEVEVMPEFEPVDFSELSLTRLVATVDDAEIDKRVGEFAEQMKSFVDAAEDQAASNGDQITIDFNVFHF